MLPIHEENHLVGAEVRCEVNQVKECSLGEFVDRDISKPDEELVAQLVVDALESPACLLARDSGPGVDFKVFRLTILQLQKGLHGGEEILWTADFLISRLRVVRVVIIGSSRHLLQGHPFRELLSQIRGSHLRLHQ